MALQLKSITKKYGELLLYQDFSVSFDEGTITCILGPSGCGKTTLLNMVGRAILPDSGTFEGIDGRVLSYIFQEPRLLPWKTAAENIGFVLDDTVGADKRKELVNSFISLVELNGFADYYPAKLSGGMRQRVAIARAFAYRSDIILMDEPLKGLDIKLKQSLIKTFAKLWRADRRTVLFVTHDVDEAMLLGNEVIVLSQAPVRVQTRVKVDVPVESRSLSSPELKSIKQHLIDTLERD